MAIVVKNHNEESPAFPNLNEYVLLNIFELLSSCDLKNARLVCKKWNELLGDRRITQKEAVFFPHFHSNQTVLKVLDHWETYYCKKVMNLKFEQRQFFGNFLMMWIRCGSKIESLHFSRCSFYPDMLLHVLTYCVNLQQLHVEECENSYTEGGVFNLNFPSENQRVIHQNLSFLDLYIGLPLNLNDLSFIASAFPQLRTLKVVLTCSSSAETNTFSALVELLRTGFQNVTTLQAEFEFENDFCFPDDFSALREFNFGAHRLENVSFSVRAPCLNSRENIEKIFMYDCWRSITIRICTLREMVLNADSLIRMLLENISLEKLDINLIVTDMFVFYAIFVALVRSSLKHLRLHIMGDAYRSRSHYSRPQADALLQNLAKNYTLVHLDLNSDILELSSLFFEYFPNIREAESDLKMNMVTIFEHQEHLQCLRIHPDAAFISPKGSMRSLEFLDIRNTAVPIEELLKFHLPNLYYLSFEDELELRRLPKKKRNHHSFQNVPTLLPRRFPNLRGIKISWFQQNSPSLKELKVFFKAFKNCLKLHYISLNIRSTIVKLKTDCDRIVRKRLTHRSLKALSITNGEYKHYYSKDFFDEKFRLSKRCCNTSIFYAGSSDECVNFKSYWLNKRRDG